MIYFKTQMTGEESVYQDVNGEMQKIFTASSESLHDVGTQMIRNLQKHIREDWYLPWGKPKEYIRRTDMGVQGALGDPQNMDVRVSGLSLSFVYSPMGDMYSNSSGRRADGDRLIEIIQKNDGWTWRPNLDTKGRKIMPRPFWDKFVEEQENNGIIDAFISGMKSRGYTVKAEGGNKDVTFAGNESKL